jgi:hypothetical protein
MTGIRFAYRTPNVSSSKKSVYRCDEYVLRRSTVLTFFFFFCSVYILAYSSVNKPGCSYEPLHLRFMC